MTADVVLMFTVRRSREDECAGAMSASATAIECRGAAILSTVPDWNVRSLYWAGVGNGEDHEDCHGRGHSSQRHRQYPLGCSRHHHRSLLSSPVVWACVTTSSPSESTTLTLTHCLSSWSLFGEAVPTYTLSTVRDKD